MPEARSVLKNDQSIVETSACHGASQFRDGSGAAGWAVRSARGSAGHASLSAIRRPRSGRPTSGGTCRKVRCARPANGAPPCDDHGPPPALILPYRYGNAAAQGLHPDGRRRSAAAWRGRGERVPVQPGQSTEQFMRRYLQHVPPPGQHRVRYFGWLHPAAKARRMEVETLLAKPIVVTAAPPPPPQGPLPCPHCARFTLVRVGTLPRGARGPPTCRP